MGSTGPQIGNQSPRVHQDRSPARRRVRQLHRSRPTVHKKNVNVAKTYAGGAAGIQGGRNRCVRDAGGRYSGICLSLIFGSLPLFLLLVGLLVEACAGGAPWFFLPHSFCTSSCCDVRVLLEPHKYRINRVGPMWGALVPKSVTRAPECNKIGHRPDAGSGSCSDIDQQCTERMST